MSALGGCAAVVTPLGPGLEGPDGVMLRGSGSDQLGTQVWVCPGKPVV